MVHTIGAKLKEKRPSEGETLIFEQDSIESDRNIQQPVQSQRALWQLRQRPLLERLRERVK